MQAGDSPDNQSTLNKMKSLVAEPTKKFDEEQGDPLDDKNKRKSER